MYERLKQGFCIFFWAACCLAMQAHADEADPDAFPGFSVHGFGTLGAVYHDEAGAYFRRDDSQPHGAGSHHLSFAPDSVLGVQLGVHLNSQLEAVVQVVTKQTWEDNYKPQVTWAYLKYMPNESLMTRVGRLGIDAFLRGDATDIDYSNLLVRPLFSFHPHSFDGADAEYTKPWNDGLLRIKGYGGWEYDRRVEVDGSVYSFAGASVLGMGLEYEKSAWVGRLALGQIRFNHLADGLKPGMPFRGLLDALPNGAQILDRLSVEDRAFYYKILTLTYDSGPWQGQANYGHFSSENWPTRQILTANVGYRIGDVTPYLGYSIQHTPRDIVPTGLPDGVSPLADQVTAFAQAGIIFNQSNLVVGARYDFARNMALKVQVDHIHYKDPDGIIDTALLSAPVESRDYNTMTRLSVALNFIF